MLKVLVLVFSLLNLPAFGATQISCGLVVSKNKFRQDYLLMLNAQNGYVEKPGGFISKLKLKSQTGNTMTFVTQDKNTITITSKLVRKVRTHGIAKENGKDAKICFLN